MTTEYGKAQVKFQSNEWTAIKADSTGTFSLDANYREGIYYTNTNAGEKFNIYFFDGTYEKVLVRELKSLFFEAYIDSYTELADLPFLVVYTKPTGNNDAQVWYHSKCVYTYNILNIKDNEIGLGEKTTYYALENPLRENFGFTTRGVQLKNVATEGDYYPNEEILYISVHSNSISNAGNVKCCLSNIGFLSTLGNARNVRLLGFDSNTGDATEAKQDIMISELQDINTKTGTNYSSGTLLNSAIVQGNTYTSTVVDMLTYKDITIFGSVGLTSAGNGYLSVEFSNDNIDWIDVQHISGELTTTWTYLTNMKSNARYLRIKYISDVNSTIKILYSLK